MARVNLRDLSEVVLNIISQAALRNHRSVEGEVRHALDLYARDLNTPKNQTIDTARQTWQKETAQRLAELFQRLRADEFFPYRTHHDIPHIAKAIGEPSPAQLLDCLDGNGALTFDMVERIATWSSCNPSWLLSGEGAMFAVENIGSDYRSFLINEAEDKRNYSFYLIRVSTGRNEGMILCIKHNKVTGVYSSGFISSQFVLGSGMGSGGHGNLERFIVFLKTHCHKHYLNACEYEEKELSTELGLHHPSWYLQRKRDARWLTQLFRGEDPSNWLDGYGNAWVAIRELPFGSPSEIAADNA